MNAQTLVAKVWNFAHVLRDQGVSYQAYISQISYLLFLKMDEERVTQIGDWFGNGTKTGANGGSGVAVLKGSKHPAEAMEFLDWFNTQVDDLVSQGLVVAATTADAKTPQKWSDYFSGQDVMAEFKTANDNMGDFTYMPGFSAVGAAMKQTAAKAADGSAKVSDVFDTAQKTSVDTLKNLGLSVKE